MKADIGSFDMHSLTHDLLELDSDQEIEQAEWNHWQEINDLGASSVATYVPDTMTLFIQRVSVGSTTLDSEDIIVNLDERFCDIKQRLHVNNSAKMMLTQSFLWLQDLDTPASIGLHEHNNHVALIYPDEEILLKMNTVFYGSLPLRLHVDTSLELSVQAACHEFCRPLKMMQSVYVTDSKTGHWSLDALRTVNISSTPRQLGWFSADHYHIQEVEMRSPSYNFP